MLSREPISVTVFCYTKEERGLVTDQFWCILYTVQCMEECQPLWPRLWRRSPCNVRYNVKPWALGGAPRYLFHMILSVYVMGDTYTRVYLLKQIIANAHQL